VCSDSLYEKSQMTPIEDKAFISPETAKLEAAAQCVLPEAPLEEDRAITRGLMRLSEKTLLRVFKNEPDIYTVEDLTMRFR
jgi:hypothetical protein